MTADVRWIEKEVTPSGARKSQRLHSGWIGHRDPIVVRIAVTNAARHWKESTCELWAREFLAAQPGQTMPGPILVVTDVGADHVSWEAISNLVSTGARVVRLHGAADWVVDKTIRMHPQYGPAASRQMTWPEVTSMAWDWPHSSRGKAVKKPLALPVKGATQRSLQAKAEPTGTEISVAEVAPARASQVTLGELLRRAFAVPVVKRLDAILTVFYACAFSACFGGLSWFILELSRSLSKAPATLTTSEAIFGTGGALFLCLELLLGLFADMRDATPNASQH